MAVITVVLLDVDGLHLYAIVDEGDGGRDSTVIVIGVLDDGTDSEDGIFCVDYPAVILLWGRQHHFGSCVSRTCVSSMMIPYTQSKKFLPLHTELHQHCLVAKF